MTVSDGFYRKIEKWLIDDETGDKRYKPFQINGNPYKANVFLVNVMANPVLATEQSYVKLFADGLVDEEILQELYAEKLANASREYKGSEQFAKWLYKISGEQVVLTSLNAYEVDDIKDAKLVKKQYPTQYERGQQIFEEVLTEFAPKIIILQGKAAVEQFQQRFNERLIIKNTKHTKIQDLEEAGLFATLHTADGRTIEVFATRSMAYFRKDGASFEIFKKNLKKALKRL